MVLQKSFPALEHYNPLMKNELGGLPDSLLWKMDEFNMRNSLAVVGSALGENEPIHKCCESCLKAFSLEKADSSQEKAIIEKIFDCRTGHNGYYVDGEELIVVGEV